jgi:hypothetical protein
MPKTVKEERGKNKFGAAGEDLIN